MKVKVMNHLYDMSKKQYEGLLKMAKEQVPVGIYAIEKDGYAELMNIKCDSVTQIKKYSRIYKSQGFRVFCQQR